MWCICSSSDDQFADEWENDLENIIANLRKARTLGKSCISKREFGRQEPELENKILELIKEIDQDVLCIKRKAVFFLTDNTNLYNERNQQIEFYKQHAQKQIDFFELRQEVQKLRLEHQAMEEENLKLKDLCKVFEHDNLRLRGFQHHQSDQNTFDTNFTVSANHQLTKRLQEENVARTNQVIIGLRHLLAGYDQEQQQLKSQVQSQKSDFEEGTSSLLQATLGGNEDVSTLYKTRFWLEQKLENQTILLKQANLGYTWNRNKKPSRNISTKNKVKTFFSKPHRFHQSNRSQTINTEKGQKEKRRLFDPNQENEDIELDYLGNS